MALRHIEHGRHLALLGAMTDQGGIAAAAQRQREGVEQNGFARAGLAGQNCQAAGKFDIEPFDQDDVTDRQTRQHKLIPSKTQLPEGPGNVRARILGRFGTAGFY